MDTLKYIFGNNTAPKTLLYLTKNKETDARSIAKNLDIYPSSVIRQLDRFENSGVLKSKKVDRVKLYSFNRESFLYKPLNKILKDTIDNMSEKEKSKIFN